MSKSFESSIRPFFGDSNVAAEFVAANYSSSAYNEPVNTKDHPELIKGKMIENVLFAENYEDDAQGGPSGKDIHPQIVDFIARTALFHKSIDQPTMMGPNGAKFQELYEKSVNEALNQEMKSVRADTGRFDDRDALNKTGPDAFAYAANKAMKVQDVNNLTYADLELNDNSSFYEYILANLFMLAKNVNKISDNVQDVLNQEVFETDYDRNNAFDKKPIRDYLMVLIGECFRNDEKNLYRGAPGDSSGSMSNFCLVSFFGKTNAMSVIKEVLRKIGKDDDEIKIEVGNLLRTLDTQFTNATGKLLIDFFNNEFGPIGKAYGLFHSNSDQSKSLVALYKQLANNAKNLKNKFVADLVAGVTDGAKKVLSNYVIEAFGPAAVTQTQGVEKLYNNVFANWQNLDGSARKFYAKHLNVFLYNTGQVGIRGPAGPDTWNDNLMADGEYNYKGTYDPSRLRLNIMKSQPGAADTMFEYTLPWLPANVGKLWYTDASGKLQSVNATTDALKVIYSCLYNGRPVVVGGQTLNFPAVFNGADSRLKLNIITVIHRNIYNCDNESVDNSGADLGFDALFKDLATGFTYKNGPDGLYRMGADGKRVRLMNGSLTKDNCAGSYLQANNGDNETCVKFVSECLLQCKKDDLSKCLDRLRDENMFTVAQDELQKMDPHVAIKILKTFGVRRTTSGNIDIMESYDSWMSGVVNSFDANVRTTIMGNPRLLDYVRGVIAFVNRHPAILNKHIVEDVEGDSLEDVNDYNKKMGKSWYENPSIGSSQRKIFDGGLLRGFAGSIYATSVPVTAMPFTNTIIGAQFQLRQRGGNYGMIQLEASIQRKADRNELSSGLLFTLMESVFADLDAAGMKLNNVDQDRIRNGIKQVRDIEDKTFDLYRMLRKLADLLAFFKATGCTANLPREVSIKQIRNGDRNDAVSFLQRNVMDLQGCIDQNNNKQNSVCNDLMKHFGILLETAGGK